MTPAVPPEPDITISIEYVWVRDPQLRTDRTLKHSFDGANVHRWRLCSQLDQLGLRFFYVSFYGQSEFVIDYAGFALLGFETLGECDDNSFRFRSILQLGLFQFGVNPFCGGYFSNYGSNFQYGK